MRHLFQKSINSSDIFVGGMYFENNNNPLNLNDGLDYVNITGNFLPLTTNSCFLVSNNLLTLLRRNKFEKLNLKWEFISSSENVMAISFRVRRQDSKGNFSVIESTRVNSSSNIRTFGQTIIDVNANDKFYMQIRNTDLIYPTSNITIVSAKIGLTE